MRTCSVLASFPLKMPKVGAARDRKAHLQFCNAKVVSNLMPMPFNQLIVCTFGIVYHQTVALLCINFIVLLIGSHRYFIDCLHYICYTSGTRIQGLLVVLLPTLRLKALFRIGNIAWTWIKQQGPKEHGRDWHPYAKSQSPERNCPERKGAHSKPCVGTRTARQCKVPSKSIGSVTYMMIVADYIRTEQNALKSTLLGLPYEVLDIIVSYAIGASRDLIHIKHTQADHMANQALSKVRFGHNIPRNKPDQLPPPGFRYAVCVASQTENAAYNKARTAEDAIERDYMRHMECFCCGDWDPMAVTMKFPFALFTSCWELNRRANDILFTTNTFSFDDPRSFREFLASLGSRQREMIRSLHLSRPPTNVFIRDGNRLEWSQALEPSSIRRLDGLHTVHLRLDMCVPCKCSRYAYSTFSVRILEDDLKPFLQLRFLPLTEVTVIISDDVSMLTPTMREKHGLDGRWTVAEKNKWADQTRQKLLEHRLQSEEVAVDPKEEARKDTTITKKFKKALQLG